MATKFLRHSDELYHYGVKGMKWGKKLFGDRIYTQKKKLKYDNNETWSQNEEKLKSARERKRVVANHRRADSMHKQFSNSNVPHTGAITAREKHGRDEALRNAEKEQTRRREAMRESSERARINARDSRERNRRGYEQVLQEQNKQRAIRAEKARNAHRNAEDARLGELNGRNRALEEQRSQSEARKQYRSELAKHARANSYANKMNARAGIEKMREEQRKESERRKRRKLASAVSRNAQYYNKR